MSRSEAISLFTQMMSRKEEDIELARAAILLAKEEYPDLDIDEYMRRIELMAQEIKRRARHNTNPHFLIGEINKFLFTEMEFSGNEDDYYDTKNSFLNDVLVGKPAFPLHSPFCIWRLQLGLPISGKVFTLTLKISSSLSRPLT